MADFLGLDIGKFQDQIMIFLETYYNLLKKKEDEPLFSIKKEGGIKWKEQIIQLLEYYYSEGNKKWIKARMESAKEYLEEATKKKRLNIEFYMILDIAELLFEIYFDIKYRENRKKSCEHIKKRIVRCIHRELIELRNELSHNENPPYEFILRFYEDQYYIIKYMKPKDTKIQLSDYITKEIKMNIHLYLEKNLKNKKSFELDPKQEEFLKFEESNKINEEIMNNKYSNKNFTITNEINKEIESMFKMEPFKLPKYTFNNQSNQNIEEQKNKINDTSISVNNISSANNDSDEDEIYEKSNENASYSSFDFSVASSLSSSGRNSINESSQVPGNIKQSLEESKTIISEYDHQKDI